MFYSFLVFRPADLLWSADPADLLRSADPADFPDLRWMFADLPDIRGFGWTAAAGIRAGRDTTEDTLQ